MFILEGKTRKKVVETILWLNLPRIYMAIFKTRIRRMQTRIRRMRRTWRTRRIWRIRRIQRIWRIRRIQRIPRLA